MKVLSKSSKYAALLVATIASIGIAKTVYAQAAPAYTLTVDVTGVQSKTGQLCMEVYNKEQGFPDDLGSGVQSDCVAITGDTVRKQFTGLPAGTYAVALVDDQNGDRKLNKDIFGVPQEGFGVSNNPTVSPTTGTPKFSQASFPVTQDTTINIVMKYKLDS
jgi:uncharacterized protein (DUF2141 family)